MKTQRALIVALRFVLLFLMLGAVLAQVLVPIEATGVADLNPEVAHLVVPYSLAAILAIACGEVVLVAAWRLLTLLAGGEIVTDRALRLVDVAMASMGVATAVTMGVLVYLGGFAEVNGGGLGLMLLGVVALCAAVLLGMALARIEMVAGIARRAVVEVPHDMT